MSHTLSILSENQFSLLFVLIFACRGRTCLHYGEVTILKSLNDIRTPPTPTQSFSCKFGSRKHRSYVRGARDILRLTCRVSGCWLSSSCHQILAWIAQPATNEAIQSMHDGASSLWKAQSSGSIKAYPYVYFFLPYPCFWACLLLQEKNRSSC
jgi:hypothetical protein